VRISLPDYLPASIWTGFAVPVDAGVPDELCPLEPLELLELLELEDDAEPAPTRRQVVFSPWTLMTMLLPSDEAVQVPTTVPLTDTVPSSSTKTVPPLTVNVQPPLTRRSVYVVPSQLNEPAQLSAPLATRAPGGVWLVVSAGSVVDGGAGSEFV
jgi:hypothetical protein